MKCKSCGHLNEVTEERCQQCGEVLNEVVPQSVTQQETAAAIDASSIHTHSSLESTATKKKEQAERANEVVEKSKEVSQMYLKSALSILKKPNQQAFSKDQTHLLHGGISVAIFAVFFSLALYFMLRKVMNVSVWGVSLFKLSFFDGAVMPFILIVVLVAAIGAALYVALMIQKIKVNFKVMLSQWLTYFVIPAGLSVIAFLFAIIGVSQVSSLLLGLSIMAMLSSVPLFIRGYQQGENAKIDPLYLTMGIYIIAAIIFSIFGREMLSNILQSFLM